VSANDYYPFGMLQPGRQYAESNLGSYRYGFNGQEKTDEIAGVGNHNTAEFWEYDPRIGKRWNMDPVNTGGKSPYATFANNPIIFVDPLGLDTVKSSKKAKNVGDVFEHQHGKSNFFWDLTPSGWEGGGSSSILPEATVTAERANHLFILPGFDYSHEQSLRWQDERAIALNRLSSGKSINYKGASEEYISLIPNFEREYQAEQESRTMQYGAAALLLGPAAWQVLAETGASSYLEFKLELNLGGAAADFINQKLIQGKTWATYNVGQTVTAGAFGGNPLQYALWGASGSLLNISKIGAQSGTMFTITTASTNAYKSAFMANLVAGGATKGFERFSGITRPIWEYNSGNFILKSIDFANGVFAAPLGNKLEEKLNTGGSNAVK
jgi:RHS repeat-associated protein